MVHGQIVALVMVNKHMKWHKICYNTYKVIAKVKVCHNDDNNVYAPANYDDDDTRIMTIPRLFSFKNSRAKNECMVYASCKYIDKGVLDFFQIFWFINVCLDNLFNKIRTVKEL